MKNIEPRRRYIPSRKRDIVDLLKIGEKDKESFQQFCRLLESIYHFEFHKDLEVLKDIYYPINPDQTKWGDRTDLEIDEVNRILLETLRMVLNKANYDLVTTEQIKEAYESSAVVGFSLEINMNDYDFIEIYARGRRTDSIVRKSFLGIKKKISDHIILERVLLAVKMKKGINSNIPEEKTILKLFKDVPLEDLEILFPNSKVVMSWKDKLILAVPAIAAGIPLLVSKVIPALIVVFTVFGAYLGYRGTVEEDHLKQSIAALSALGALGGFVIKQISKFKTKKFLFQKELSDNLYFRNLVNNAGVFHSLIDSAEEEEFKEALLAYIFINRSQTTVGEKEIDSSIEQWLYKHFDSFVDFECTDALDKLEKLKLLNKDNYGNLTVIPLNEALKILDFQWDNYFAYNK